MISSGAARLAGGLDSFWGRFARAFPRRPNPREQRTRRLIGRVLRHELAAEGGLEDVLALSGGLFEGVLNSCLLQSYLLKAQRQLTHDFILLGE
jgi:hypothetical protein